MVKNRLNQLIEFGDNIHRGPMVVDYGLELQIHNDIFSLIFSNIQRQAIEPLELNRYVRTMLTEFNL